MEASLKCCALGLLHKSGQPNELGYKTYRTNSLDIVQIYRERGAKMRLPNTPSPRKKLRNTGIALDRPRSGAKLEAKVLTMALNRKALPVRYVLFKPIFYFGNNFNRGLVERRDYYLYRYSKYSTV